jgi:hypothetical protein
MGESTKREIDVSQLDLDSIGYAQLARIFEPDLFKNQDPVGSYHIFSIAGSVNMSRDITKKMAVEIAEGLNRDFGDVEVWRQEGGSKIPIWPSGLGTHEPTFRYKLQAIDHLRGKTHSRTRWTTKSQMLELAKNLFPELTDVSIWLMRGRELIKVWPEK